MCCARSCVPKTLGAAAATASASCATSCATSCARRRPYPSMPRCSSATRFSISSITPRRNALTLNRPMTSRLVVVAYKIDSFRSFFDCSLLCVGFRPLLDVMANFSWGEPTTQFVRYKYCIVRPHSLPSYKPVGTSFTLVISVVSFSAYLYHWLTEAEKIPGADRQLCLCKHTFMMLQYFYRLNCWVQCSLWRLRIYSRKSPTLQSVLTFQTRRGQGPRTEKILGGAIGRVAMSSCLQKWWARPGWISG